MTVLTIEQLETITLKSGSHPRRADGVCVMEAVAWLAGEKHTDEPSCVSPVIAAFLRKWNDDLDDAGRQRLKPYVPKVIGIVASAEIEDRRAWMLTDWIVRVHTPAWLDLAGLKEQASALRSLPDLTASDLARAAHPIIDTAREKAAAARDAAGDAARDAARDALKPTVVSLQESAFELLDRLIPA